MARIASERGDFLFLRPKEFCDSNYRTYREIIYHIFSKWFYELGEVYQYSLICDLESRKTLVSKTLSVIFYSALVAKQN